MQQPVICITKDTLYAVKFTPNKEYWRVAWSKDTWASTISDVVSTLGTNEFYVLLTNNLPTITESTDQNNPISMYSDALKLAGCNPLSIQMIADMPENELIAKITDYLPQDESMLPISKFQVGSLEDVVEKSNSTSHLLRYSLVALAGVLIALGIWFIFGNRLLSPQLSSSMPSPSIVATSTPEPTLAPSVIAPSPVNQEYQLQIQNGSGIVGIASKLSAKLEGEGFVIKDVSNADNYSYKHSVLQTKSSVAESTKTSIQQILNDVSWENSILPETSKYDIVIIIGQASKLSN